MTEQSELIDIIMERLVGGFNSRILEGGRVYTELKSSLVNHDYEALFALHAVLLTGPGGPVTEKALDRSLEANAELRSVCDAQLAANMKQAKMIASLKAQLAELEDERDAYTRV